MKKITILFICLIVVFTSLSNLNAQQKTTNSKTTFIVVSLDDTGDDNPGDGICDDGNGVCTFRAAIEEANANAGQDIIAFNIDETGPYTFSPVDGFPPITETVIIDGTTEPDYDGTPIIEIDGSYAGETFGIDIQADECIIRGIVVNSFGPSAIIITSNDNIVEGCFIGVNFSGTEAIGNGVGIELAEGVSGNLIGGSTPEARNIISGNNRGLYIWGCYNNTVSGNYIGLDVTGTAAIPNTEWGMTLGEQAYENTVGGTTEGERNIISGNGNAGIGIWNEGTHSNLIIGNYLGTDVTGTVAIGNNWTGIFIGDASSDNIVGGTNQGEGNLISGGSIHGLVIGNEGTSGNQIMGNYIGTEVSGLTPLPNTYEGIMINDGANNNIIGGNVLGAGNVVSGNGRYGISLGNYGTAENVIQGNFIGTDITGTTAMGNGREGIVIWDYSSDNTVEGNIIAFNGGCGVLIDYNSGTNNNAVTENSIFSNNEIGIDLSLNSTTPYRDGITINDSGDADEGPNKLQNYPVITNFEIDANEDVLITYNIDSDPMNSAYPIVAEFFEADENGQGQRFIANDIYSEADFSDFDKTINLGNATEHGITVETEIAATATDNENNTSEFYSEILINIVEQAMINDKYILNQNYPNPFSNNTNISFTIKQTGNVNIVIYDIYGKQIKVLLSETMHEGDYNINFDGSSLSGGVYIYELKINNETIKTKEMILVK